MKKLRNEKCFTLVELMISPHSRHAGVGFFVGEATCFLVWLCLSCEFVETNFVSEERAPA
jgi:hypothetical protein